MAPVTTMQIYKGAIPFLILQLAMVAILIAFPGLVTRDLDRPSNVDMEAAGTQILQNLEGAPGFGNPAESDADAPTGADTKNPFE